MGAVLKDACARGMNEDGGFASFRALLDAIDDGLNGGEVVCCCGVDGDLTILVHFSDA